MPILLPVLLDRWIAAAAATATTDAAVAMRCAKRIADADQAPSALLKSCSTWAPGQDAHAKSSCWLLGKGLARCKKVKLHVDSVVRSKS